MKINMERDNKEEMSVGKKVLLFFLVVLLLVLLFFASFMVTSYILTAGNSTDGEGKTTFSLSLFEKKDTPQGSNSNEKAINSQTLSPSENNTDKNDSTEINKLKKEISDKDKRISELEKQVANLQKSQTNYTVSGVR